MVLIAGCIVEEDGKILMVKEAKKKCYGQWNFPAGHLEENETVKNAAIREVLEETGYEVEITGVLPIFNKFINGENAVMVRFVAKRKNDNRDTNPKFDKNEILSVEWMNLEKIEKMDTSEIRDYELNMKFFHAYNQNKIFSGEIFQ